MNTTRLIGMLAFVTFLQTLMASEPSSIRSFAKQANSGSHLNVVFFGGSLTWGANASDPLISSWRGRMMKYLTEKFPKAHFAFHDAAIGGTGSMLGLFRLERDVLSKKPDLVFLDFTMNDGAEASDPQTLAAYEHILRAILESGSAVQPIVTTFRFYVDSNQPSQLPRVEKHLELFDAYGLAPANIHKKIRDAVKAKHLDPMALWTLDGAHPDDSGYDWFFGVVRDQFEENATSDAKVRIPIQTVFPDMYRKIHREILVDLACGWRRDKPRRTSLWFDGLSSRWMGDVAVVSAKDTPSDLEVKFQGSMVGFIGERDGWSPHIKVWIDGKPIQHPNARDGDYLWPIDTSAIAPPKTGSGNLFHWQLLAKDLADGEHTLRIHPVWDHADKDAELRIESICSAGR